MTKKKQLFILVLIIVILLALVAAVFFFLYANIEKKETQENISDLSQLPSWVNVPDSATNVSYCRIFWLYHGYEFDTSEEEFLKWAKKWPVQKITEPTSFMTFRRYTLPSPNIEDAIAFEEYNSKVFLNIHNGFYYEKENENQNGGGIRIAYDKDKQRAYFSFAFR